MTLFNKKNLISVILIMSAIFPAKSANYAIDLSGTGTNYARTTSAPLGGNPTFTIEFWFNVSGVTFGDYARMLGFTGYAFEVGLTNANSGTLAVFDGSWRTSTATGMKSGWHHVAVTSDKTTMYVYVDGSQVYTKAAATFAFSSKLMYIGSDVDLSERISGMYDEVRVWNTAKSLTEINANRVKELTGTESGLLAYYASKDDGNMLSDFSSSGNHLVSGGTVKRTVTDFGLYLTDYAMNFASASGSCKVASPLSGDASFTLEAQFMIPTTASTAYSRIFAWYPYAFEIAVDNGVLTTYKGTWQNTSVTKLNDGKWHHVAASKSGTVVKVYFDGIEVQSRTVSAFNFTGAELHIGASITSDLFPGSIDEVRVWNVSSTQTAIISRMKNVDQTNASGLVAYYDFNRPGANVTSTTTVKNLVTSGNPLTRTGGTQATFNPITNKILYPAVLSTSPASRCGSGTVTLQATPTFGSIRWFNSASGGTSLGTGNSFTTPSLTANTTYYAEAFENSTSSLSRTAVLATINDLPTITGSTPAERCGSGTLTLGANGSSGSALSWFSSGTGGTSLGTGNSFTTPSITNTTNYYVEAALSGCTSSRTAVAATIKTIPTITTVTVDSICFGGSGQLSASASQGNIQWYAQLSGEIPIYVGTTFNTPEITSSTTWYAEAISNGCTSATRTSVEAVVINFDNSVTKSDKTLTAVETNAAYKWLECVSNAAIPNETAQSFTPTTTGDYKVEITKYGCVDTSACVNVSVLGILTPDKSESRIGIYPNPGTGIFHLEVPVTGSYLLLNSLGQKVQVFKVAEKTENQLDLSDLPSGLYWIQNEEISGIPARKLLIQR